MSNNKNNCNQNHTLCVSTTNQKTIIILLTKRLYLSICAIITKPLAKNLLMPYLLLSMSRMVQKMLSFTNSKSTTTIKPKKSITSGSSNLASAPTRATAFQSAKTGKKFKIWSAIQHNLKNGRASSRNTFTILC